MGKIGVEKAIAIAVVAAGGFVSANTYYYVGASNKWDTAACYSAVPGGEGGAGLPGLEDRVVLSQGQKVYIDDDTIAFFSTIKEVHVAGHDISAFFHITTNACLGCNFGSLNSSVWTNSFIIKTGAGTLTATKKSAYVTGGYSYGYYTGIDLREGNFVMEPSSGNNYHCYTEVRIAEGSTVYGVTSGETRIARLSGKGTLTNTGNSAELRITGVSDTPTVFSGVLSGYKIFRPAGHIWLTGTANTIANYDNFIPYNYVPGTFNGTLGFMTWAGDVGTPSSLGRGYVDATAGPFRLLYLGETGETINRTITLRNTIAAPAVIDAGAHGGLVFKAAFSPKDTIKKQQRFEFTGSNVVYACILSNQFARITADGLTCSFFVKKTGSGIWRFADRDSTDKMSGVIGAEQGTLEFETIRPAGFPSSLGTATDLYEDKCDTPANLTKVPYANYLGDGTDTEAVFSYTGTDAPYIYDRPLAVNGVGRFRAPNAPAYAWNGIRALGSGESRIVFECAAGQTNKVAGFVDGNAPGGDGTLSIEKDGPGDLVVSGDLSFGGDLIARGGGTLTVKDINGQRYEYYRLNIKENVAGSALPEYDAWDVGNKHETMLNEFGLYSEDRTRQNVFNYVYGTATNRYVATLDRSRIALENEELITLTAQGTANVGSAGRLLDNYCSGGIVFHASWKDTSKSLSPDNPSSWIRTVLRLPANAPAIKYFDINYVYPYSSGHSYFGFNPTAFSIEGSADGITWEEVYATNNIVYPVNNVYYAWLSEGVTSASGDRPERVAHPKFELSGSTVRGTYAALGNLRSISVASGTTLKFEGAGTVPAINKLTVDVSGVGTIDGFAFGSTGTLALNDVSSISDSLHVAADLSRALDRANLRNWKVALNGTPAPGILVRSVTAEGFDLVKRGLVLGFR